MHVNSLCLALIEPIISAFNRLDGTWRHQEALTERVADGSAGEDGGGDAEEAHLGVKLPPTERGTWDIAS